MTEDEQQEFLERERKDKEEQDKLIRRFAPETLLSEYWNPDREPAPRADEGRRKEWEHERERLAFYSRGEIAREMHVRAPQPIGRFARISFTTRLFPSLEDTFRRKIRLEIEAIKSSEPLEGVLAKSLNADECSVYDYINQVAPVGRNLRDDDSISTRRDLLDHLDQVLSESLEDWNEGEIRKKAETQLSNLLRIVGASALRSCSDEHAEGPVIAIDPVTRIPLRASMTEEDALSAIRSRAKELFYRRIHRLAILVRPLSRDAPLKRGNMRLRCNWERYTLNQNFAVIEDAGLDEAAVSTVARSGGADFVRGLLESPSEPSADDGRPSHSGFASSPELTAIESMQSFINAESEGVDEDKRFQWFGRLFTTAHYWIVPCREFAQYLSLHANEQMRRGLGENICRRIDELDDAFARITRIRTAEERERAIVENAVIGEVIGAFGREVFRRRGRISGDLREDFVLSSVVGGRALLLSELRPPEMRKHRDPDKPLDEDGEDYYEPMGLASRTLIIDLGMTPEQRGRLVGRLFDVAAFRMLALRGYPAISQMADTLSQISTTLNQTYGAYSDAVRLTQIRNKDAVEKARRYLNSELEKIMLLARATAMLNPFVTYGITGKSLSSSDYRDSVRDRTEGLREHRIPGFQTLEEIITRFHSAVDGVERVAARYDFVRRRLDEVINLIRAQLQAVDLLALKFEAVEQSDIMGRLNLLTVLFIGVALIQIAVSVLASGPFRGEVTSLLSLYGAPALGVAAATAAIVAVYYTRNPSKEAAGGAAASRSPDGESSDADRNGDDGAEP